jgi:hypothetical protein
MRRVDGTRVQTKVSASFGSLALKALSKGRFQVVDVTGAAATITGTLPKQVNAGLGNAQLWGDWVMVPATDDFNDITVVFNYRTGAVKSLAGAPQVLGDGFAVVYGPDGARLWNLADDTDAAVPGAETSFYNVATDGTHRIAFSTDDDIVVRTVTGTEVGATRPLLLGLIAPSSLNVKPAAAAWTPQIDASKPLNAGTLTIKDAGGATVRTLTVNASADGSIRDLSWDGRTSGNVKVTPGTYTWGLDVTAADGSGSLRRTTTSLDSAPLTGTIKVTDAFLGTVSFSTPKVSDTTPVVDQRLTAKTGTPKPATATYTYQWLRDGVAIPDATEDNYTPLPTDVGHKLAVSVTGKADAWRTTTRTSASTSKVAKATLFAPKPVIDPTPAEVGKQLRASPEEWSPEPIHKEMQWYRVDTKGRRTLIKGATNAFYDVTEADEGFQLQFAVTGSKDGYNTKTMYSALTKVVPKPQP